MGMVVGAAVSVWASFVALPNAEGGLRRIFASRPGARRDRSCTSSDFTNPMGLTSICAEAGC